VPSTWPALPYELWRATCDTLHAHTQVLGTLAVALAPPEPQLLHAALRLSARGWETLPLPAPDRSGAFVVALDLRTHEAVVEHNDGRVRRIPLAPNRSVSEVTREVLTAVRELVGPVRIDPPPQETPWSTPLEDDEHATYEPAHVATYLAAATLAALVLAARRAPYRGRSTPVNAWWGTFDLAVILYSGRPATAPSDDFIMRNAGTRRSWRSGGGPVTSATTSGVLRLRVSDTGGIRARDPGPVACPLGQHAGRIRARLGRRSPRAGSAPGRRRVRAVGVPARLLGGLMGSGAGGQRTGNPPAPHPGHPREVSFQLRAHLGTGPDRRVRRGTFCAGPGVEPVLLGTSTNG
jgi:Family of unknown function (DUF5996)